jgi:hypothetical protein
MNSPKYSSRDAGLRRTRSLAWLPTRNNSRRYRLVIAAVLTARALSLYVFAATNQKHRTDHKELDRRVVV